MIEKLKAQWTRVPAWARSEAKHDAGVFAVAFVGTAKELAPALLGTPSMGAGKALVLAALLAGGKAAVPAARVSGRHVLNRWLTSKIPA